MPTSDAAASSCWISSLLSLRVAAFRLMSKYFSDLVPAWQQLSACAGTLVCCSKGGSGKSSDAQCADAGKIMQPVSSRAAINEEEK